MSVSGCFFYIYIDRSASPVGNPVSSSSTAIQSLPYYVTGGSIVQVLFSLKLVSYILTSLHVDFLPFFTSVPRYQPGRLPSSLAVCQDGI